MSSQSNMNLFSSLQGGHMSMTGLRMLWQKNRDRVLVWPKRLILRHTLAFDVIILLLGASIMGVIIFTSLYVEPVVVNGGTSRTKTLDVDTIDTLELWLEEFQAEHQRPLQVNPNVFYAAPDKPLTP